MNRPRTDPMTRRSLPDLLLVILADGWRDKPSAPRVWEAAARVAARVLGPDHDPAPKFPGPLPAGYENPHPRRGLLDG